jgi:heat shock protein HtpX
MSVYSLQSKNIRKTWLLIFLFIGLISAVFYIFGLVYDSPIFGFFGLAISLIQALVAYFGGDKIALAVSGSKEVSEEEQPQIHELVNNLSKVAGIPKPKVYVSNDPSPNAFATGRDPKHASISINQGLLDLLNKHELEGVIAHELSHIANRDILVMTVVMVLAGVVSFLADIGMRLLFLEGGRVEIKIPVLLS